MLLNPAHSETRRSASFGEELMHVALGHPASTLQTIDGVPIRTCRQDFESEAYAVAIAMLLPYRVAFRHINDDGDYRPPCHHRRRVVRAVSQGPS